MGEDWEKSFEVEEDFKVVLDGWSHKYVEGDSLMKTFWAERDDRGGVAEPDSGVGAAAFDSTIDQVGGITVALAQCGCRDTHAGRQAQIKTGHWGGGSVPWAADVDPELDCRSCSGPIGIECDPQFDGVVGGGDALRHPYSEQGGR